jgi:uroporphyrinogen decarboxylase
MNKLINTLIKKEKFSTPPIWIMRQAGRYLPEYREIRSNVKNFLDLCYNPKLACEVTLQPIQRFGFDAAIIFSDILVIPDALGVKVEFVKNEGPKLQKISNQKDLKQLKINNIKNHLNPVFEAIELTKSKLNKSKSLIGFSGSPWTLACYMIEGGGSKNFESVRKSAIQNEEFFFQLIEILTQSVIEYLSCQIKAGADVVKLFDSWASVLPPSELQKWVIEPTKKIVLELKKIHPKTPIICFPRGIGINYLEFARQVKCDAIAIDQTVEKNWAKKNLQEDFDVVLQGNLDNFLLAFGSKKEIEREVFQILKVFSNKPFIFNLGHGILPQTPIENVELVLKIINNPSLT